MARFSEVHIQTIRERLRNDIENTLSAHGIEEDDVCPGLAAPCQWELLLDALVEDGMHPLEKIVADINDEDLVLGRNQR